MKKPLEKVSELIKYIPFGMVNDKLFAPTLEMVSMKVERELWNTISLAIRNQVRIPIQEELCR